MGFEEFDGVGYNGIHDGSHGVCPFLFISLVNFPHSSLRNIIMCTGNGSSFLLASSVTFPESLCKYEVKKKEESSVVGFTWGLHSSGNVNMLEVFLSEKALYDSFFGVSNKNFFTLKITTAA